MSHDLQARIVERRRHWQQMTAEQRIDRVHTTVADVIAYARRRRQLGRRHRNNDFLFLKEQTDDSAISQ